MNAPKWMTPEQKKFWKTMSDEERRGFIAMSPAMRDEWIRLANLDRPCAMDKKLARKPNTLTFVQTPPPGSLVYIIGTTALMEKSASTLTGARARAKEMARYNFVRECNSYVVIEKLKVPNRLCLGTTVLEKWTTNARGTPVKVGGKRA